MQVSRGGEGFSPINERAEEGNEDGQHAISRSRKNLRGILVEGDLSDLQIMRLCFKQFQASLSSVPPSRAIFFSFFLFLLPPLERPCASTKGRVGFSRERENFGKEILGKTRGEEPPPPPVLFPFTFWKKNSGGSGMPGSWNSCKVFLKEFLRRIKDDPGIFSDVPEEIFDTVNPLN